MFAKHVLSVRFLFHRIPLLAVPPFRSTRPVRAGVRLSIEPAAKKGRMAAAGKRCGTGG